MITIYGKWSCSVAKHRVSKKRQIQLFFKSLYKKMNAKLFPSILFSPRITVTHSTYLNYAILYICFGRLCDSDFGLVFLEQVIFWKNKIYNLVINDDIPQVYLKKEKKRLFFCPAIFERYCACSYCNTMVGPGSVYNMTHLGMCSNSQRDILIGCVSRIHLLPQILFQKFKSKTRQ